MDYFYRVRKFKKHYYLDFQVRINDSGFVSQDSLDTFNTFSVSLDNYISTHNMHSTGLDFYGFISSVRASGFVSTASYADWTPFNFSKSKDYFFVSCPTNLGYISPRGSFLKTGNFHANLTFRFHDFYNFFAGNGILIL